MSVQFGFSIQANWNETNAFNRALVAMDNEGFFDSISTVTGSCDETALESDEIPLDSMHGRAPIGLSICCPAFREGKIFTCSPMHTLFFSLALRTPWLIYNRSLFGHSTRPASAFSLRAKWSMLGRLCDRWHDRRRRRGAEPPQGRACLDRQLASRAGLEAPPMEPQRVRATCYVRSDDLRSW